MFGSEPQDNVALPIMLKLRLAYRIAPVADIMDEIVDLLRRFVYRECLAHFALVGSAKVRNAAVHQVTSPSSQRGTEPIAPHSAVNSNCRAGCECQRGFNICGCGAAREFFSAIFLSQVCSYRHKFTGMGFGT